MKKRFFSLMLGVTTLTVIVTAVNCGCAFAEIMPQQAEEVMVGHCEHHESAKKSPDTQSCCVDCNLENAAIFQQNINPRGVLTESSLSSKQLHIFESYRGSLTFQKVIASLGWPSEVRSVFVSGIDQPIFLTIQSFLI